MKTLFDLYNPEPDPRAGEILRDRGTAKALEDPELEGWKLRFEACVRQMDGKRFSSEDIIDRIGLPRIPGANRNNAVGAMMRGLAQRGLIVRDGFTQCRRPRSHARLLALWRVRCHGEATGI